jgi:hypothetical protein
MRGYGNDTQRQLKNVFRKNHPTAGQLNALDIFSETSIGNSNFLGFITILRDENKYNLGAS